MDHDPLNEQSQQLWRQRRDIRVPLCFIKEAVRPAHGYPQALALSFCGIPVAFPAPHGCSPTPAGKGCQQVRKKAARGPTLPKSNIGFGEFTEPDILCFAREEIL